MIFHKFLKWPVMILCLAIAFLLQYVLIANFLPDFLNFSSGLKNPDQLSWYSDSWLQHLYLALGDEGRQLYQKMLFVDFFYATFAGIGYSMLLYFLTKNTKWKWISITPLIMTFFDYAENIIQILLLKSYPDLNATLALLSAMSSFSKLAMGGIGILFIVIFGIRWGYFRLRMYI
jgi:hypothetical protein